MWTYSYTNYNNDFLVHYGIVGMHWGVRRYQNPDGSLTPAGRIRYGVGANGKMSKEGLRLYRSDNKQALKRSENNKPAAISPYQNADGSLTDAGRRRYGVGPDGKMSKEGLKRYREDMKRLPKGVKRTSAFKTQKLEKYIAKGNTAEEANKIYKRRKAVVIGTSVAAAALAAYGAYKLHSVYGSKYIKEGQQVQRIALDSEKSLHNVFYAAVDPSDKIKYEGMYAYQLSRYNAGDPMKNVYTSTSKIKVASNKQGERVYKQLAKSGQLSQRYNNYIDFNSELVSRSSDSTKFYNALSKKGYGGVLDINDMAKDSLGGSGYLSKKPIIFFGGSADKMKHVSTTRITDIEKGRRLAENLVMEDTIKLMKAEKIHNIAASAAVPVGYAAATAMGVTWGKDTPKEKRTH